jgi:sialate O-acetylesterase
MIGEVWIASGQSNMQWPLSAAMNAEEEVRAADYPLIRLYNVPLRVAAEPRDTVDADPSELRWRVSTPETAASFSAVAYFFGRHLHQLEGVPVGLINSSWGGTPAESWTSRETLQADAELRILSDRWDEIVKNYQESLKSFAAASDDWSKQVQDAIRNGAGELPAPPKLPDNPHRNPWFASGLYNAMIHPLIPYAFRGAIWYQGESNASRAAQYRKLFPAMIQDWRKHWNQGEFPFLFVQLANFIPDPNTEPYSWAELREAQHLTLALPNTGMAVITDIGDPHDIHPRNKQEVGRRLALAAERIAYDKRVAFSGPVYRNMEIDGDRICISFTHARGGLYFRDGAKLRGFTIAGEDGEFKAAEASIQGDRVVVSSPEVANPKHVRYNWAENPDGNLYNLSSLPAAPFRTDDFPLVTADNQ